MGNNKEIGKLIRYKFENFEVSPNDDLWGKIDADLNKNEKKRRFLPWFTITTLLGILLLGVVVYENKGIISKDKLNQNLNETHSTVADSNPENKNEKIENDSHIAQQVNDSNSQSSSGLSESDNLKSSNGNTSTNRDYIYEKEGSKFQKNNFNSQSISNGSKNVNLGVDYKLKSRNGNTSTNGNYISKNGKNNSGMSNYANKTDSKEKLLYTEKIKNKSKSKLKKNRLSADSNNYSLIETKKLDEGELEKLSNNTKHRKKYSKTIKVIKMNEQHTEIEVVEKYVISIEKTKKKTIGNPRIKSNSNSEFPVNKESTVKLHKTNKKPFKKSKKNKIKKSKSNFGTEIPEETITRSTIAANPKSNSEVVLSIKDSVKTDSVHVEKKILPKKVLKPETKKKVVKEEEEKKKKGKDILWGIQPVIGENIIGNYAKGSLIGSTFDKFNTATKSSFSYGFYVSFIPYDKFSIRTGVLKNQFITENDLLDFNGDLSDIDLSSDFYYGNYKLLDDSNNAKLSYKVDYFEFPLEVAYTFKKMKKFSFDVVLGASYIYVKTDDINFVTRSNDSYYIGKSRQLKNSNYSINTGLNAKYDLNNNFSIVINPMFRNFIKLPSDKSFNTFQMSLQAGLLYKF